LAFIPTMARAEMAAPRQLAFALGHGESFAREDFLAGPQNAAALALIERWPKWPARNMLLVGPEGSGKSHLAAIWGAASGARTVLARLLEETTVPDMLATGALVVEDLAAWHLEERALFHLLNLAREETANVLFTARSMPGAWAIALPDLASRLREIPIVTLDPPDDALLRAVLVKLFADRQLAVDESLIAYLVTRMERSFAAARACVAALDREALRQQRPVTRALAGELFRDPAN
jgi:chromosomal replication initiation ATPase DnaA